MITVSAFVGIVNVFQVLIEFQFPDLVDIIVFEKLFKLSIIRIISDVFFILILFILLENIQHVKKSVTHLKKKIKTDERMIKLVKVKPN